MGVKGNNIESINDYTEQMKRFTISLLVLYLFGTFLKAEENYQVISSNPLFEKWRWKTIAELSNTGVRSFTEGKDHTVWFGTSKGVFYYDGLHWKQYFEENEVLKAPVYGLCYTTSGSLYAISTKGICHFTKGSWKTDVLFPEKGVLGIEWEELHMIETGSGEIFAGVHFGLFRIKNGKITLFSTATQLKELQGFFKDIDIQDVSGVYSGIEALIVFSIMEDHAGNLWIGLEDGRILRLLNKNHDIKVPGSYVIYDESNGLGLSRQPILYESKEGIIYNVTQTITGAVNRFNPANGLWTHHTLSNDFGGDNINFSLCETPDKAIWIGGLDRVFVYRNGKWAVYKQPRVLVPATRVIIRYTSDGSLWLIGHQADVIRIEYNTPKWTTYEDLIYQCETNDGRTWFINGSGKIIYYNPDVLSWRMLDEEFPMSDPVRIYNDKNGTLWALGSHNGQAALAWNSGGSWMLKIFPDLCWSFHPNGVFESRDKSLWFGSNADCGEATWGIVRYSPSKGNPDNDAAWQVYTGTKVCEVAYALGEADNNDLLCGYYKGLFEYNGTDVRELHQVLAGDIIKVESMVQDPVKGVWIGSRGMGVIHYINDNEWKQYTVEDGLASNIISSMIFSGDGTMWVATDKGISRYDGSQWNKLALPDYFKIVRGTGSLELGNDSSVWINNASMEWYRRVFYKKQYDSASSPLICYRVKPEKLPPETEITKFDKKVYYPGNTMIVWRGIDPWEETKESDIQFSYRLDKNDWSGFSNETNHTFLSMIRGWHTIQVKARDNFLNVDPKPATIKFKVIPPIWGQMWFILLMAGLIGSIIYLFRASINKNRKMEEQNLTMKEKNADLVKKQAEIEEKGKQIMELLEKERASHWFNEGVIAINDVIKSHRDDIEKLAHAITVKLIDYLEVHSAGIMLARQDQNDSSTYLELISAYGYNKERLSSKKIMLEEGLAGACYKEKKTMIFRNIPESYFVESGMGKTKVAELALIPLKLHDEIVGIIEISSLKPIEDKVVELLEIVTENIASNILSLDSKAKIEAMYKQSQENTARLHEQEEELHQQMEELQATQEESHRRERELLAELEDYKKKRKK
jgi:ligand-binding sensor domain-containing protein